MELGHRVFSFLPHVLALALLLFRVAFVCLQVLDLSLSQVRLAAVLPPAVVGPARTLVGPVVALQIDPALDLVGPAAVDPVVLGVGSGLS